MISAVLDVNVLVSGFPEDGGIPRELLLLWLDDDFELIVSEHILGGVTRAWNKDYYRFRYRSEQAVKAIDLLRLRATVVTPAPTVRDVADDEEDDLVLATAVAGRASHLVTGDNGLLRLAEYDRIAIVTPRDFLALFD